MVQKHIEFRTTTIIIIYSYNKHAEHKSPHHTKNTCMYIMCVCVYISDKHLYTSSS